MATGGPSTARSPDDLYKQDDVLNERLLHQIFKWIIWDELRPLAQHLGISSGGISRVMNEPITPEEKSFEVCRCLVFESKN